MIEYINWIALVPTVFIIPLLPAVRVYFRDVDISKFAYGAATTGILLTFFGIWRGLLDFDIQNSEQSIPTLVEGLKIAFSSSLTGLGTSMFINLFFVSSTNDVESSLEKTVLALEGLKISFDEFSVNSTQQQTESLMAALNKLVLELEMGINTETKATMTSFRTSVEFLRKWQEKYVEEIQLVTAAMDKNALVTITSTEQLEKTNKVLEKLGPVTAQIKDSIAWTQQALPQTRKRGFRINREDSDEE